MRYLYIRRSERNGRYERKKIILAILLFTSMSLAVMPIASGKGIKRILVMQMIMKN